MKLTSQPLSDGDPVPTQVAMGVQDPQDHATLGANRNPDLQWSALPDGTESLALIVHDPDVPSQPDDVNQEGTTVPADPDRIDYYHWVLLDLDPDTEIEIGAFSDGVTAGGKDGPEGPNGTRQGLNDYTNWFEGDPDMEGEYYGYDGPFPPWNDEIVHHYHFTLYALDCTEAPVDGTFTGDEVLEAIEPHILDEDRITGLYSLNPDVDY
jgi:Raf kinase inhibitor-like YbhB/YbcL family protein